ncbi:hypothetical protein [Acuticoccus sp.]|uniref:hypothetical protein n=1 Tax=Acuticoccus sp. TaxID=1904378 RepID=UPI003B5248DC
MTSGLVIARARASANFGKLRTPMATSQGRISAALMRGFDVLGGMWIPGTATLFADTLAFEGLALHRAIYGEAVRAALPLAEVDSVTVRSGIASRVVVLAIAGGVLRLRGFQIDGFAARVEGQRRALAEGSDAPPHTGT